MKKFLFSSLFLCLLVACGGGAKSSLTAGTYAGLVAMVPAGSTAPTCSSVLDPNTGTATTGICCRDSFQFSRAIDKAKGAYTVHAPDATSYSAAMQHDTLVWQEDRVTSLLALNCNNTTKASCTLTEDGGLSITTSENPDAGCPNNIVGFSCVYGGALTVPAK